MLRMFQPSILLFVLYSVGTRDRCVDSRLIASTTGLISFFRQTTTQWSNIRPIAAPSTRITVLVIPRSSGGRIWPFRLQSKYEFATFRRAGLLAVFSSGRWGCIWSNLPFLAVDLSQKRTGCIVIAAYSNKSTLSVTTDRVELFKYCLLTNCTSTSYPASH